MAYDNSIKSYVLSELSYRSREDLSEETGVHTRTIRRWQKEKFGTKTSQLNHIKDFAMSYAEEYGLVACSKSLGIPIDTLSIWFSQAKTEDCGGYVESKYSKRKPPDNINDVVLQLYNRSDFLKESDFCAVLDVMLARIIKSVGLPSIEMIVPEFLLPNQCRVDFFVTHDVRECTLVEVKCASSSGLNTGSVKYNGLGQLLYYKTVVLHHYNFDTCNMLLITDFDPDVYMLATFRAIDGYANIVNASELVNNNFFGRENGL